MTNEDDKKDEGSKVGYLFLVISFFSLIFGLSLRTMLNENMFFTSMIITTITGGISIIFFKNLKSQTVSSGNTEPKFPVKVFVPATLYTVIAGFAIKNTTEFVSQKLTGSAIMQKTSGDYFVKFILTLGSPDFKMGIIFLAMAIPFYYGAMIFLSEKGKAKGEKDSVLIWHFGILFTQAIIFLGVSTTLNSVELVAVLFVFLMLVDSIWIIVTRKMKIENAPPIGWLSLNLCFTGLLFLIIYKIPNISSIDFLLASTIGRLVVDIVVFRDMYRSH